MNPGMVVVQTVLLTSGAVVGLFAVTVLATYGRDWQHYQRAPLRFEIVWDWVLCAVWTAVLAGCSWVDWPAAEAGTTLAAVLWCAAATVGTFMYARVGRYERGLR